MNGPLHMSQWPLVFNVSIWAHARVLKISGSKPIFVPKVPSTPRKFSAGMFDIEERGRKFEKVISQRVFEAGRWRSGARKIWIGGASNMFSIWKTINQHLFSGGSTFLLLPVNRSRFDIILLWLKMWKWAATLIRPLRKLFARWEIEPLKAPAPHFQTAKTYAYKILGLPFPLS